MTRRGTLYDPETHELVAHIEHGGISTGQDADSDVLYRAEFYVLEEVQPFRALLKKGLAWVQLAGGLEGLARLVDIEARPGRLIRGRLHSLGAWQVRLAPTPP